MSDHPAVKITGCTVVTNLIERAKDLVPFDLPLMAIHSGTQVWTPVGDAYSIAYHVRRALDVNTSYPVIMCEEGFIMDGWHRVLRALIDKVPTIKAVRFDKTPPCDYYKPPQ